MSMLNTDCICMACYDKEQEHPLIGEAKDAEQDALKRGDRNYKGLLHKG